MFPIDAGRLAEGGRAVKVTQAYRFALDPSPAQERALRSHAGAARFAWNWRLARRRAEPRHLRGDLTDLTGLTAAEEDSACC